jgi:hypothetical protein
MMGQALENNNDAHYETIKGIIEYTRIIISLIYAAVLETNGIVDPYGLRKFAVSHLACFLVRWNLKMLKNLRFRLTKKLANMHQHM